MANTILFCHHRSGSSLLANNFMRNYQGSYSFSGIYDPEMLKGDEGYSLRPWIADWLQKYNYYDGFSNFDSLPGDHKRNVIRRVFFETLRHENHVMFKHFTRMDNIVTFQELLELKDSLNLSFVSLTRTNLIATAVSYVVARVSDVWLIDDSTDVDSLEFKSKFTNLMLLLDKRKEHIINFLESDIFTGLRRANEITQYMDLCLTYEEDIVTNNYIEKINLPNKTNMSDFKKMIPDYTSILADCPWLMDEIVRLSKKYQLRISDDNSR